LLSINKIINKLFKRNEPVTVLGYGQELNRPRTDIVDIKIPDSFRKGHFWCFGTTRVGKTKLQELMIEQDIRKGNSVVVIDPKIDHSLFAKIVQVAFEEGRHNELMLITPVFPDYSAIIDPLAYYFMPEELVGHIVSGVEVGKEKFFFNVSYEISLAVVMGLLILAKNEGKAPSFNLNDVKNKISRSELERLKVEIDSIDSHEARQLSLDIQKILDSPADYYGKVSSSLRVALMELTTGNIGKIIGKADENKFIKRLENNERVILIVQTASLLTRKASCTLGKVVVSMIQSFVGRVLASNRVITPPLCVYVDEAQSVLYHGIEEMFAKAGGAGLWMHGFCQSVNQLYATIGQETGKVILDNTNTKVFMRVPDYETAEYVVEHFGEARRYSPILSVGGGISMRQVEEPALKPSDVMNLPERKFYMMSYEGRYMGMTNDVEKQYITVKFPNINLDIKKEQKGEKEH